MITIKILNSDKLSHNFGKDYNGTYSDKEGLIKANQVRETLGLMYAIPLPEEGQETLSETGCYSISVKRISIDEVNVFDAAIEEKGFNDPTRPDLGE